MRFILSFFQNILRWFYIIGLFILYVTAIYRVENKRTGLPILALALLMPFFMHLLGKIALKVRQVLHLFQRRAKRKSIDVITLLVTGGILIVLFCLQKKMPVSLYGGFRDKAQILWNQILVFNGMVKHLWMYWIFFATLAAIKILKRNIDLYAALLLGLSDAFLLFGMISGYTKIGYYGFAIFSVLLMISYFRLLIKETYGETFYTDEKKSGFPLKFPKGKSKKKQKGKGKSKNKPRKKVKSKRKVKPDKKPDRRRNTYAPKRQQIKNAKVRTSRENETFVPRDDETQEYERNFYDYDTEYDEDSMQSEEWTEVEKEWTNEEDDITRKVMEKMEELYQDEEQWK